MNIKSLLLGSAVASVAFTGAQAADAIFVPEPEPMEYVRVCDVYGAGFFYIPGTETCLKVGGYVRYQINWNEGDDGWRKQSRAQLTLDARNETELGTLRSFAELWFQNNTPNNGGSDDGLRVRQAFIELGGLYLGTKITLWDGALDGEYDNFGFSDEVHTVGYNFAAANGVNVGIALEEYDDNLDYTPNVVGKVGIKQGWGSLNVFAAYDATAEEWAAKAIANVKLADPLTLQLAAAYSSGNSVYAPTMGSYGTSFTGFNFGFPPSGISTVRFSAARTYEWTLGAHLKYDVSNKLTLGVGGQYYADAHNRTFVSPLDVTFGPDDRTFGGGDDWAVGAVVDYKVAKGFDAKLAVNYVDGDSYADGAWNGFLRLTRSF
ncbi:porin [Nitratireductor aestuarii]|uniref:Porin n=1 Tax=Nitratireductor aestuarii TaxID=1735103 RepID=A0A916RXK3_9HYPH|nr:porin [Nitratireductor aestuarii]GGA75595.1 porin [Nitratireductor aestuarii]